MQAYEYYWLVDPLDGTKEFIKRNGKSYDQANLEATYVLYYTVILEQRVHQEER